MQNQSTEYYLQQGLLAYKNHRLKQAEHYFRLAKNQQVSNWESYYYMGCLFEIQNLWSQALQEFKEALHLKSDSSNIYLHLGFLCGCLKQWKQSSIYYLEALRLDPQNWEISYELANSYFFRNDFNQAKYHYNQAQKLNPNSGLIYFQLGLTNLKEEQLDTSIALFLKGLEIEPTIAQLLPVDYNLGLAYFQKGLFSHALQHFKQVTQEDFHFQALICMGHCYRGEGQLTLAQNSYNKAEKRANTPTETSEAFSAQASILDIQNRIEEAYTLCQQSLRLDDSPLSTLDTYATICLRKGLYTEALTKLLTHLKQPHLLPYEKRGLLFKVAHLFDKNKEYKQAFAHLQQANQLKTVNYSPDKQEQFLEKMFAHYSLPGLSLLPQSSLTRPGLIFIVGMPRSGSTLIEQILDSHSQIFGAGELQVLPSLLQNFDWKDCVSQYQISKMSQHYLNAVQRLSPAPYIVDKMLLNYQYLGLISQLFPNSYVIHCQRHPLDTCLSCFFQDFTGNHPYMYNLEDLGHYYLQYSKLMKFWQKNLSMPIYSLSYEQLINFPENTIRQLLNFCQLKWEKQCLNFFQNPNLKLTASYAQIQEPLYSHSIERYKNYQEYLKPLKKILTPVLNQG